MPSRQYYFVFLNTNPNREQISEEKVQELQSAHLANIEALHTQGKLVAAGPFVDGGGIFILVAPTLEEAKSYLFTDPAVKANRFNVEIYSFDIHIGDLYPVGEEYKMVTYQLVQFSAGTPTTPMNQEVCTNFMGGIQESSDVILAGTFKDNRGGIIILNMESIEAAQAMILKNPLVEQEQLAVETRGLWIAKETFFPSKK